MSIGNSLTKSTVSHARILLSAGSGGVIAAVGGEESFHVLSMVSMVRFEFDNTVT